MVRRTALAVVAGVLVLASSGTAHAADLDCKDFPTQKAAQAKLDEDRSDPHRIDRDKDGVACETFDFGGGSSGGQSDDSSTSNDSDAAATLPKTGRNDTTPIVGAFAAFLIFAGAAVLSGVRRVRHR